MIFLCSDPFDFNFVASFSAFPPNRDANSSTSAVTAGSSACPTQLTTWPTCTGQRGGQRGNVAKGAALPRRQCGESERSFLWMPPFAWFAPHPSCRVRSTALHPKPEPQNPKPKLPPNLSGLCDGLCLARLLHLVGALHVLATQHSITPLQNSIRRWHCRKAFCQQDAMQILPLWQNSGRKSKKAPQHSPTEALSFPSKAAATKPNGCDKQNVASLGARGAQCTMM